MERLGLDNKFVRNLTAKAKRNPKKVVFAEADTYKVLKAAEMALEEGIAEPILLGREIKINKIIQEFKYKLISSIGNWKVLTKYFEEPLALSVFRSCFQLEKFSEGLYLNIQKIRVC